MTNEDQKQANLEKTWTIFRVVEAVVLITLGVLNIVYFQNDGFTKIIFYVLGSLLAVDGVLAIVKYYIQPMDASTIMQEFVISIFEIAFGVLFIVEAQKMLDVFKDFLALFISVVCFSAAFVFGLGATLGILHKKRKTWVAVVEYIVCALLIAGGVLLIIYRSNAEQYIWYTVVILCGLIMLGLGIYAIVSAFVPFRQKKPKKVKPEPVSDKKDSTVDVDKVEEKKEEAPKEKKERKHLFNRHLLSNKAHDPENGDKPVVVDVKPEDKKEDVKEEPKEEKADSTSEAK